MSAFIELTTIRFDGKGKTPVYLRVDQISQVRTHSVLDRAGVFVEYAGADLTLVDASALQVFESPMEVLSLLERADVVDYLPPPPRMMDPF